MASPHQEARLAAASLLLSANPITGARVAQYESEDSLEPLVAAGLAAAMEEEQKKVWQMRASAGCHNFSGKDEEVAFESTMNFSDIYHSDEEYFRKLKDLKAVHEETMSKLEKMYQDKLNIKDIQAGLIRDGISDASSRPAANDKPKEEELYGDSRMQPKVRDLLQNSPWPSRSAGRRFRDPRSPAKPRGKHRRRCLRRDGDLEKWKEPFSEYSFLKCPMLCEECCLHESPCDSDKRQKLLADIRADEENLRETRRPCRSPRRKSPGRSSNPKPRPHECSPPMPTASSRGREQAIRKSLEEKKMLEEERNRILTKQKQRMKDLQKLLATRVKAYGSHQSLSQIVKARVKELRRSEKARMREYWQELEEQEEKLQKRPMLFERVTQRNARMAAERCYSNTLKALGLLEEFVSEKGQSGKVSEDFTRQELRSCTLEKESSYGEERENEEENYLTDISSQDSCKGNKEDVKESGEENCGE